MLFRFALIVKAKVCGVDIMREAHNMQAGMPALPDILLEQDEWQVWKKPCP